MENGQIKGLVLAGVAAVALGCAATEDFVSKRPAKRAFESAAVERVIRETKAKIKCPKLAWMFENCYPNTLDTTVRYQLKDGEDDTFVITGDIEAMWLRDSAAQVWPYLSLVREDQALARMIRGVIRRQLDSICLDPYANAFNFGLTSSRHASDKTTMKLGVFERKYELDSLCYPLRLAAGYARAAGDDSIYDDRFRKTLRVILDTMKEQQRKKDGLHTSYTFQREAIVNNAVENYGYGRRVKPCGLIVSMFRPSDDTTTLPFLIPSNFFAVDVLNKTAANLRRIGGEANKALADECAALSAEVRAAIDAYGVVEHPKYGKIYAFEVDGFGSHVLMDDANVPSLLALPYFTDMPKDDPIYQNTRRFVLSEDNPYFFRGSKLTGIGGPHVGDGMVWPMSIILQGLTANTAAEREACIRMLVDTDGGTGFMHESAWKDDPAVFSRSWFAWANTLFGELVLKAY